MAALEKLTRFWDTSWTPCKFNSDKCLALEEITSSFRSQPFAFYWICKWHNHAAKSDCFEICAIFRYEEKLQNLIFTISFISFHFVTVICFCNNPKASLKIEKNFLLHNELKLDGNLKYQMSKDVFIEDYLWL